MFRKQLRKWGFSVFAILLGSTIILVALLFFNIRTISLVEEGIHRNMAEISDTASLTLRNNLISCQELLRLQAKMMGNMETPTDAELLYLVDEFAQDARFERTSFVTFDGKVYSSAYGVSQLENTKELPNLKADETLVGAPRVDATGALTIDIGTPVYRKGERIGRLLATIDNKVMQGMYIANGLDGDAALCLFDSDGTVIATFAARPLPIASGDNTFAFTDSPEVQMLEGTTSGYQRDVISGKSGWLQYQYGGDRICLYHEPFGLNGWTMSITATDHTLNQQAGDFRQVGIALTACILLVVIVVCAIVIVQRIREQERIDALKNTYSVAIRKTNDLFYEADIDSDQLVDHSESTDKAVWKETPKNYSKALTQIASVCTPECRQEFLDNFLPQNIKIKVKEGISSINFEYKIAPDENTVRWISATFVPVVDGASNTTKLICMENDITERRMRQERLKHSATVDGLTGLYNKMTAQNYIDSFLEGEGASGAHALMIIDIDHFKQVNDTLGHAKGDEAITEFAAVLRRVFRRNDIVGRIGGDEFAVLLKDYGVMELILAKAREICVGFQSEQFLEDEPQKRVQTSASIGIALYDKDGKSFGELYRAADAALYTAKDEGRNRFAFYDADGKRDQSPGSI